jgi:hypothetical protein
MDKKYCPRCEEVKPVSEFRPNKKRKDGFQSYCLVCDKAYQAEHYARNKERYVEKALDFRRRRKDWFKEFKSTLKCERCGEDHPACLQFHHEDPDKKVASVYSLVWQGYSWETINEEIEKCEVLCANCHLRHHWDEHVGGG